MATTFPPPTGPSLDAVLGALQPDPTRRLRQGGPAWWTLTEATPPPRVHRSATATQRVWSSVIDLGTYGGSIAVATALVAFLLPRDADGVPSQTYPAAMLLGVYAIVVCVVLLRWLRALSVEGATTGRRSVRIAVVRVGTREPLGYARGLVRVVSQLVLLATIPAAAAYPEAFGPGARPDQGSVLLIAAVAINLLDAMWMLWDPRHQTLHDKLAGSVVIEG